MKNSILSAQVRQAGLFAVIAAVSLAQQKKAAAVISAMHSYFGNQKDPTPTETKTRMLLESLSVFENSLGNVLASVGSARKKVEEAKGKFDYVEPTFDQKTLGADVNSFAISGLISPVAAKSILAMVSEEGMPSGAYDMIDDQIMGIKTLVTELSKKVGLVKTNADFEALQPQILKLSSVWNTFDANMVAIELVSGHIDNPDYIKGLGVISGATEKPHQKTTA